MCGHRGLGSKSPPQTWWAKKKAAMIRHDVAKRMCALRAAKLPERLVGICERLYANHVRKDSLSVVEFFAGVQTVVRAARENGFPAAPCHT